MTPKLRMMLDSIEEMLMDLDEGGRLADVLSALRGPDSTVVSFNYPHDDVGDVVAQVKYFTTGAIRSTAFPRLSQDSVEQRHSVGWVFSRPAVFQYVTRDKERIVGTHFAQHVLRAAWALDLEEKNDDPETA